MTETTYGFGFASLLLTGAIFGFFFAWVCSTMWGLDAVDPRVAIQAMQGMNASVRNAVFAPAFFATPFVCLITAALCFSGGARGAGIAFAAAGIVYLVGGMGLTMAVNVPMNEVLAVVEVPEDVEVARDVWATYSSRWQLFNLVRTIVCGVVLLLSGSGLVLLARTG